MRRQWDNSPWRWTNVNNPEEVGGEDIYHHRTVYTYRVLRELTLVVASWGT